jgi:NAD(P)-dependent dehydrogenase (short-subunit alcohol dehydrogenase family)
VKREVLIFGANGALGKGVTAAMIKKNYDNIYLFDFNIEEKTARDRTQKINIKDLAVEKNVADAFSNIKPSRQKLFFLYSTVGGFAGGKNIMDTEEGEWNRMMDMNLKANFYLAKYFSKLVEKSAGGSICFTAAETGVNAEAQKGAYGISKSAVIHLVKTLSLEGKAINLSANAIAPYIIDTPANRDWMKDSDYTEWIKPEEIGNFAHSLFENFNFVSGNILRLTSRFNVRF